MSRVNELIKKYAKFVSTPWLKSIPGAQKVWFIVYDKTEERRLRMRIDEFDLATRQAGHGWKHIDIIDIFGEWMAQQEYKDSYFESPTDLENLLPYFKQHVVDQIISVLKTDDVDTDTVVAISGVAGLFGFLHVSDVVNDLLNDIRGRLLVFFPGEYEDQNYRLLDARDGWNYLAVPITAHDE